MFIGEFLHRLDDKGRVALPRKFRDELKGGVVITRGLDSCLFVYSVEEWKKMAEKLSSLPLGQTNSRAFVRLMLSGAMDSVIDKQGRIVIADYLKKYAKLKKKAVMIGLYNRIEVWDEEIWTKYKQQTEADSLQIAENLSDLSV
jgi:MraZ protein